jgi:hypothetical protein
LDEIDDMATKGGMKPIVPAIGSRYQSIPADNACNKKNT